MPAILANMLAARDSVDVAICAEHIADSVAHAKFVCTDLASYEVVLMAILNVRYLTFYSFVIWNRAFVS